MIGFFPQKRSACLLCFSTYRGLVKVNAGSIEKQRHKTEHTVVFLR